MLFDAINIALVITALLNGLLGVVIFLNGHHKKINVVYSLNIVAIISWTVAMIAYRSAPQETSMFWSRILYITPTFIASSFLYFTYIFPSERDKHICLKSLLIFLINAVLVVMVAWPGFIIEAVNIRPGFEKQLIFTNYYWFYFLYTAGFFTFGFVRLFRKYTHGIGVGRLQTLYLWSGYAIAANLAFISNLILPWIGVFIVNWLGQVFTISMVAFTAYAILKYRLMDIRIVARRVFIYFGDAIYVYAFFYFVIWFYNSAFGGVFSLGAYAVGLIVAPLFVFLFYSVDKGLRLVANRYLFVSLYNYQETINKLTEDLNHYIDLDKIIDLIVDTIRQTMQLNRAGVLLVNTETRPVHYEIAKVIGFNRDNGISLVQDNFLTQYLQETEKPLVLDELELLARDAKSPAQSRSFEKLYKHMTKIEASLCLPLMSGDKLFGIIVLGAKRVGDAYTKEDLDLLSTLSKQAGVAVENARLYAQVQEFNQRLKLEVDKATADIMKTNVDLEAALKIKDVFLQIASHQLRTPVSVMYGVMDTFKTAGDDMDEAQRKQFINSAFQKSKKLGQVVDDVLSATEMNAPDFNIGSTAKPMNLREMAQKAVEFHKEEADTHKLTLILEAEEPGPAVKASEAFLPQAISNLVDNSIKYTPEGGSITVKAYTEGDMAVLAVTDTGMGVPPDDLGKLWDKFKRGKNAKDMHTDGSGLGLFIIKKIVEGHEGGSVFAESELGKGSTFGFKLPVIDAES